FLVAGGILNTDRPRHFPFKRHQLPIPAIGALSSLLGVLRPAPGTISHAALVTFWGAQHSPGIDALLLQHGHQRTLKTFGIPTGAPMGELVGPKMLSSERLEFLLRA